MGWLGQLLSRRRRYDELSESIREHLDEKVADLMDHGMTREHAERAARREFGNVTRIEEQSREVWQWPTLQSLWADLNYTFRQILKNPGFSVVAILSLALGIGATTSMFSLIYAVLLHPVPYADCINSPYRGLVTKEGWKYVCFENQSWLMFNLNEDPYEQVNVAFNAEYQKERKLLIARLKKRKLQIKDEIARIERVLPRPADGTDPAGDRVIP